MAQKLANPKPKTSRPKPPHAPPSKKVALTEKQTLVGILSQMYSVLTLMSSHYAAASNKEMIKELLDETKQDIINLMNNG